VKTLRFMSYVSALALLVSASPVRAQESPYKFEFKGFVTGSLYYQDEVFAGGQGQGLTFSAPSPANQASALPGSGGMLGGDVRQSRFSFGVTGPAVLGGTPRAYLELDFFGLLNAGAFGPQQQHPRLRIAIVELRRGNTAISVGQQNQLIVPQIPASIAHIANPMTYGAGTIAWRTPGVRVTHGMPMGAMRLELAAEAVQNTWAAPAPANTPQTINAGEASGLPMFQGRLSATGKAGGFGYNAYLVGVWHRVDLRGFARANEAGLTGAAAANPEFDGYALQVGGRATFNILTVAANYYMGQATGNMLGSLLTFGDIADWGAWVNVGVNATKELSIWGIYGTNRPDEDDVRAWGGARIQNDLIGGMIRYARAGYQVGVEGYRNETTWAATNEKTDALQIIGSVGYFF
jgi:hypothetical protein